MTLFILVIPLFPPPVGKAFLAPTQNGGLPFRRRRGPPQRSNSPDWVITRVPTGCRLLVQRVILHMTALTSAPVWISAALSGQEKLGKSAAAASSCRISRGAGTGLLNQPLKLFSVTRVSVLTHLPPEIRPVLASFPSTVFILEGRVGVTLVLWVLVIFCPSQLQLFCFASLAAANHGAFVRQICVFAVG